MVMTKVIDVGTDFYYRLIYIDGRLGEKNYNAVKFKEKYLKYLDNKEAWKFMPEQIIFDFKNVKIIGPTFARDAFGYFTKYASAKKVLETILFANISFAHREIITFEIEDYEKWLENSTK